jgi:hypothetical protein
MAVSWDVSKVSVLQKIRRWRGWFPVPVRGWRPELIRWTLLEGNRLAIVGALLTFVYATIMISGIVWTFQIQVILTETTTVENLLDTFLSGIILLVSIVVSINSIVLSQDITGIDTQEQRIRGVLEFNHDIGEMTETDTVPTDPHTFMEAMAAIIKKRALAVNESTENVDPELAEEAQEYVEEITEAIDHFEEIDNSHGAEYAVLWQSLNFDYGLFLNRSRSLRHIEEGKIATEEEDPLARLTEAFQVFAIGREYFKTLYYTKEVSKLSRTLLVVSLPAILTTSIAILAINANILPAVWVLGLPPLQSFVATMFTIALMPYIVLTSYMLRLSTVAMRTATGGPFSLT